MAHDIHLQVSKRPISHYILAIFHLLRPRQWIKNSFVLAPLIFSGTFFYPHFVYRAFLATWIFCLAASFIYVINDIHDEEADRHHPIKAKTRPLAAGMLSKTQASITAIFLCILLGVGFYWLPLIIFPVLIYIALNVLYTFVLKNQPIIDIFVIAFGFVIRVYAGGAVLSVPISNWMLVTTLCLALYLAVIKRKQEMMNTDHMGRRVLMFYSPSLIHYYAQLSSTGALVFYSLFVMSQKPQLIISIPVVLYGLFRYAYVVDRLQGGESPTDTLLTDPLLLFTAILWVGICLYSYWPK